MNENPVVIRQVSESGVELVIRADGSGSVRLPQYDYLNASIRAVDAVALAVARAEKGKVTAAPAAQTTEGKR